MRDLTKLPKWAAQHIRNLERDLAAARAELAVQGDVAETNVTFQRPASLQHEYVPRDASVQFVLPSGKYNRFRIRVRVTDAGALDVNADARINVSPNAANSLTISEAT